MIKIADEIELDNFISSHQFGVVSFVNPHSLYTASIDDRFRCALENNVINCLDGVGASSTYKYFAGSGKRITGRTAYKKCVKFALETEMSLIYLCSSNRAKKQLEGKVPINSDIIVVPRLNNQNDVIAFVQGLLIPDNAILFTGISSPKQDILADEIIKRFNVKIFCIGAVVDFVAELQKPCPEILSRYGFEWLFRLVTNPKRLANRTLISLPSYFYLIARRRIIIGKDGFQFQ